MVKFYARAAAAALSMVAVFSIQPAEARPSMSRGEQFLSISESVCENRARVAFANDGWTDITGQATFVKAHKDHFASYITCNAAAGGGVVVNIFVAYDLDDTTGGIAGGERTALQDQMEKQ